MIPWLVKWERIHRCVVVIAMLAISLTFLGHCIFLTDQQQILFALVAVGATGVSHGAVDHIVDAGVLRTRVHIALLISIYVFLAVSFALLWNVCPAASLVLFLALSVLHFGLDIDSSAGGRSWSEMLLRGAIPILIPCWSHSQAVAQDFRYLGCNMSDHELNTISSRLFLGWLCLAVIWISIRCRSNFVSRRDWSAGQLIEHASLFCLCYFTPPLISFTVYFCGLHSFRQTLRLAYYFDNENAWRGFSKFWRLALPMTLVSLGGAAVIFDLNQSVLLAAEVKTLFVSLSALTIPHMLLSWVAASFKLPVESVHSYTV